MKVLREGESQKGRAAWWIGKIAECTVCGCRVQLEEGDDKGTNPGAGKAAAINVFAERHPGGKRWIEGQCPTPECPGKIGTEDVSGPFVPKAEFLAPVGKKGEA